MRKQPRHDMSTPFGALWEHPVTQALVSQQVARELAARREVVTECDCGQLPPLEPDDSTRAAKRQRAYKLGSIDAYAERPMRDMGDADSAWLMGELGETEPTTAANWDYRASLCERYFDGYQDAESALR